MPSVGVKDVEQQAFVRALSAFLQKSRDKAKGSGRGVDVVKNRHLQGTGPLVDEDWFYTRCASVGPAPLHALSVRSQGHAEDLWGVATANGVKPSHFCPASASVAPQRRCQALRTA
uniref:Putative 40s ribosomal protein s19 n=1 Tax=Ixodes ricinus TaxID=34613 RepID=V5HQY1_IXORI